MLETEIAEATRRYNFLLQLLHQCNQLTENALKNDKRWFSFAPKIGVKFLNQAITLQLLFGQKTLEMGDEPVRPFEDLSAIFSLVRMQFETHALFYHLFMPCKDMQENILRFRLWELDGIRGRIAMNKIDVNSNQHQLHTDQAYLPVVEAAITELKLFQQLNNNQKKFLFKNAVWRFSVASLQEKDLKTISYSQLISMTGFNPDLLTNLYAYLSMHTHPSYVGVVQNFGLTDDQQTIGKYTALTFAGMVTAMMIEDLSKRFKEPQEHINALNKEERPVFDSMSNAARGRALTT